MFIVWVAIESVGCALARVCCLCFTVRGWGFQIQGSRIQGPGFGIIIQGGRSVVERWHVQNSQGQIMALAFKSSPETLLSCSLFRSKAVLHPTPRGSGCTIRLHANMEQLHRVGVEGARLEGHGDNVCRCQGTTYDVTYDVAREQLMVLPGNNL